MLLLMCLSVTLLRSPYLYLRVLFWEDPLPSTLTLTSTVKPLTKLQFSCTLACPQILSFELSLWPMHYCFWQGEWENYTSQAASFIHSSSPIIIPTASSTGTPANSKKGDERLLLQPSSLGQIRSVNYGWFSTYSFTLKYLSDSIPLMRGTGIKTSFIWNVWKSERGQDIG